MSFFNQFFHELDLKKLENQVILYDGVCGLCNRFVYFVLRHDTEAKFQFMSLQSEGAKQIIGESGCSETVYFMSGAELYSRSRAVFKIVRLLGFPWNLLCIFQILPSIITDRLYDFIARNRYKWFGKYESCPVPPIGWRDRFIDSI